MNALPCPSAAISSRGAVRRIACAVVAAELRRLRQHDGSLTIPPGEWPDAMAIGDEGLGLDSIEQLGALGALAEAFDLDDSLLGGDPPRVVGEWIDWIMAGHAAGDARMTVRTSGSTGQPLPCAHALADLLDEAAFLAARFADRRRVVALVPAHHLYGIIWTALLPAALGVPVVDRTIGTALRLMPGDLVVAVPDQWQAMLRLTRRFPHDVAGVSSAAPLGDDLAVALATAGLARLTDIYGSSETSGIALRDLPAAAYTLLPRWTLAAAAPAAGGDDWCLRDAAGRIHALPDRIERTGDRSIRPVRRRDGAVQVAGHNVRPDRVAAILREVDGVADAAVRLHVNGRLKAFVVPRRGDDPALLAARIERLLAIRLTDPERPRALRFGDALPRNEMGKLKDWA